MQSRLRWATLCCHALLMLSLGASALTTAPTALRATLALLVVAPLAATTPGLASGRRPVERWLALLLVLYIGGASVEVVARAGTAPLLDIALLAAVLELGLLLAIIRRRPRAARG